MVIFLGLEVFLELLDHHVFWLWSIGQLFELPAPLLRLAFIKTALQLILGQLEDLFSWIRPKKQGKTLEKPEKKKEAHNVEFAEEPVQDIHNVEVSNEVSMADAPKICDTIGKQQNVDESIDSSQPTHSQLHHLDCLHLQEMEQCVQSVESTASQWPWSTS